MARNNGRTVGEEGGAAPQHSELMQTDKELQFMHKDPHHGGKERYARHLSYESSR